MTGYEFFTTLLRILQILILIGIGFMISKIGVHIGALKP